MRALTFDPRTDQFCQRELPIPRPGDQEVLVRVLACGLNPVDAKITRWKSLVPEMDENWTPGLDVSGEIVELGSQVRGWRLGQLVLYHGNLRRPHGGFAEYALHEAATLVAHPAVSPVVAASTPCAGWTAWRALRDKLRATASDSILITGGSGGVGGFALQIARQLDLPLIIATCSARNHDYVRQLGATHTIDYQTEEVAPRVREITQQTGVTLALDTVGPDSDLAVVESLAFEGALVELVEVVRPALYREVFQRGLSFHQLSLGSAYRMGATATTRLRQVGVEFSAWLEAGRIQAPRLRCLSLDEVGPALQELRAQRSVGKMVMDATTTGIS